MNNHICPRCERKFPEWQPVHFACLAGRLRYWIYGMAMIVAIPILLLGYQIASTTASALSIKLARQETLSPPELPHEQTVNATSTVTKQKPATPTSTTPREAPPTFTPTPKPTATQKPKPTSTAPLVLQATPKAVSQNKKPLAIDFLIDGIEMDLDTVKFHITIFRRADVSLPWGSDEGREDKIYLQGVSNRYRLTDMGGLFVQNTTLEPQTFYEGWFVFEKPAESRVVFHYPDVDLVEIDLTLFDLGEQRYSDNSLPTPTPYLLPTHTPIPQPKTITCSKSAQGAFSNVWQQYKTRLGCPIQEQPIPNTEIILVEQPFSQGHMFYFESGPIKFIIVKYGTGNRGTWQSFDDVWDGRNDNHCFEAQEIQPKITRGFNLIWCTHPEIREPLGWPLDVERDIDLELAQGFENGFALRDSDGHTNNLVYLFFNDGTYERVGTQ